MRGTPAKYTISNVPPTSLLNRCELDPAPLSLWHRKEIVLEINGLGRHELGGFNIVFLNQRRGQDLHLEERHVLADAVVLALKERHWARAHLGRH